MPRTLDNFGEVLFRLLSARNAGSQTDICKQLEAEGIKVTQPTVSRCLRQMGAVKMRDAQGKITYRPPRDANSVSGGHLITDLALGVEENGFVIVVSTRSGCAGAVAQMVDEWNLDGILGTVAGDSTILVVPRSINSIREVAQNLRVRLQLTN